MTVHRYISNSSSRKTPISIGKRTSHDAHDGDDDELLRFSKGMAAPYFEMRDAVMGREYGVRKAVKERCRCEAQSAYLFPNISPCSHSSPGAHGAPAAPYAAAGPTMRSRYSSTHLILAEMPIGDLRKHVAASKDGPGGGEEGCPPEEADPEGASYRFPGYGVAGEV